MNTTVQALERFRAEIGSHVSQIEVALALGATPNRTTISYVQATVGVSLILRIDSPRSLGIVWLPSLMAGMSS
jgi:putative ABC transport system permease protein